MGWHPQHLQKPLVGVVNSFNELMPGHFHLNPLCQAIKLGIAEAGGTPLEFPSIAVCDGIATGHVGMKMPMLSRELIADSIEVMVTAHGFDAIVLLSNCDKVTPGMLMAAGRLNIPAILVTGGPMDTGCYQGRKICYTDLIEAEGLVEGSWSAEGETPPRKYYVVTAAGQVFVAKAATQWRALNEAMRVLEEEA